MYELNLLWLEWEAWHNIIWILVHIRCIALVYTLPSQFAVDKCFGFNSEFISGNHPLLLEWGCQSHSWLHNIKRWLYLQWQLMVMVHILVFFQGAVFKLPHSSSTTWTLSKSSGSVSVTFIYICVVTRTCFLVTCMLVVSIYMYGPVICTHSSIYSEYEINGISGLPRYLW